jgi:hypothetical protein
VVICDLEKAELSWYPPKSSIGKQIPGRCKLMNFKDSAKTFRSIVHKFVGEMELDYKRAECY